MANWRGAALLFVTVAAVIGWFAVARGQQDGLRSHPGIVIDYYTSRPVRASVKAWAYSPSIKDIGAQCPTYGTSPLFSTESAEVDGGFILDIPSPNSTYTVVYCNDAYFTRVDPDFQNRQSGSFIVPLPVQLWPRDQEPSKSTSYRELVRTRLAVTLSELAYLRGIDVTAFDAAVSEYAGTIAAGGGESRASVVKDFAGVVGRWSEAAK